ncbi:hypothetical protein ZWY2020_014511 [Hordeum vulgare]|nr:hypothetical protein ZWY2020_014511 [Hordeum vulgare]
MVQPQMLQYKSLIHLDTVTDFTDADEPFFLGGSSDIDQSGLPEEEDMERGGRAQTWHRQQQFGVRDIRGRAPQDQGNGYGDGRRHSGDKERAAHQDWRLSPMEVVKAKSVERPAEKVQDRPTV